MGAKTNAMRLLTQAHIPFRAVEYTVDPDNLAADHVAASLGEDVRLVYKTLVLHGDKNGLLVCVLPGDKEVDLKKAARVSGNKKVEMLPMRELLPTTGYIRGGCSPVGMKKRLPTYIQKDCLEHEAIYISGGQRGLQLCLAPADLIKYTGAIPADFTADE